MFFPYTVEDISIMSRFIFLIIGSYLLGSIPIGMIVARLWSGVDIRSVGSKNIGATNVARSVSKLAGIITLFADAMKGAIPVIAARIMVDPRVDSMIWVALAGLAAFFGHCCSVFLKFRGGKGVATALGVFLASTPWAVLPALALFIGIVAIWRYVSLGSMIGSASLPVFIALFGYDPMLVIMGAGIAAMVVSRHVENIKRLIRGEENAFSLSKK